MRERKKDVDQRKKKRRKKKLQKKKLRKFSPPVLPPLHKPPVEVDPDRPLVEHRPAQVLDRVLCVRASVIDDEREAARRPPLLVESHHDAEHVAGLAEHLVELLLRGVEREIPDVEGGGGAEALVELLLGALEAAVAVGGELRVEELRFEFFAFFLLLSKKKESVESGSKERDEFSFFRFSF